MGAVTSLFARKVVRAAGSGVDPAALLHSVGLTPDGPDAVDRMVPADDYYALLERIARALPDGTALPLKVGASMRADDYGAFGLAWKTAPTLRGSLERAERYGRLLTSVSAHSVAADGTDAVFHLHRAGERRLGLRLSNEATLASAMAIMREVATGDVLPRAVTFTHPAPADTAAHRAYFGCPVEFDAAADAIRLPAAVLDRPNRQGDPAIARYMTPHLEAEVRRLRATDDPLAPIRRHIADALSAGPPTLAVVAIRSGMSARTLQRRIAAEGETFQGLVDAVRADLARGLLADSRYPLAEIAFLTGFSEQSAFTRAFRRWTGKTPAAFRTDRGRG